MGAFIILTKNEKEFKKFWLDDVTKFEVIEKVLGPYEKFNGEISEDEMLKKANYTIKLGSGFLYICTDYNATNVDIKKVLQLIKDNIRNGINVSIELWNERNYIFIHINELEYRPKFTGRYNEN